MSTWDVSVSFSTWRQNPAFVDATLVTLEAPPNQMGDYHLAACPGSPACNLGAASKPAPTYQQPPAAVAAPTFDVDDQVRPALGGFDTGADEVGGAAVPPPPPPPPPSTTSLYFSTSGSTNPPGAGGTADDADIYLGSGDPYIRDIDASPHRTACRPARTSTASTGWTRRTSTCPSPARHDPVPGLPDRG